MPCNVFCSPSPSGAVVEQILINMLFFVQAGFKDVVHLEGGLSQWRHDKYPIEESDVNHYTCDV